MDAARPGGTAGPDMSCPSCQHDNPTGARFCTMCGAALPTSCPTCGAAVPAGARFCGACGAALAAGTAPAVGAAEPAAPARPAAAPAPARGAADTAENRQLTVLFCDLVGSTALSEQLDPEALRDLLRDYQATAGRVIAGYDGHLAKYLGDGLLTYFGYPRAHEDDAVRAVRAGLAILEGLAPLRERVARAHGLPLHARIGIHTGPVLAGDMAPGGALEAMAVTGRTPNIASRLQELADPDTVVVSADTLRLVRGFFETTDLGDRTLKGVLEPVGAHRVVRESGARSRLEAAADGEITPIVGRDPELGLLAAHWQAAVEGQGAAVLLEGEAGIGKSRIVRALKEVVAADPGAWLTECLCSPYHAATALYPVVDLLQRVVLDFERGEDAASRLAKVEGFGARYGLTADVDVPLLADLVAVPLPEGQAPPALTPERKKQRTLDLLADILYQRAAHQPVLFVLEDLHWVDPTTAELLERLIDRSAPARILIVGTTRPGAELAMARRPDVIRLTLSRLATADVRRVVAGACGDHALPDDVVAAIVARTDGVPLYVEELTRMLVESGHLALSGNRYVLSGALDHLPIPATLQGSLMARLDRLADAKPVVQLAACIGRDFGYDLLAAAFAGDDATLRRGVAQLVDAQLVFQRGQPPDARYVFKHALIQDAAYDSLPTRARRGHHQRIAAALEGGFPDVVRTEPEVLAQHHTAAGSTAAAIPYWRAAGLTALGRSANLDAITHFQRGLALLAEQPPSEARDADELSFQLPLSAAILFARGYATPDIVGVLDRAYALCAARGDSDGEFHVLWGIHAWRVVRAEYDVAFDYGNRLMALAQARPEPSFVLEAHHNLTTPAFYRGRFRLGAAHGHDGWYGGDIERTRYHAARTGQNSGVTNRCYEAIARCHLGELRAAIALVEDAVALARELNDPFSLGYAAHHAGWLYHVCGLGEAAEAKGQLAMDVAAEQAFGLWAATGQAYRGAGRLLQGRYAEAADDLRAGRDGYMGIGAGLAVSYYHGMLAEALWRLGDRAGAERTLADAFAHVAAHDERFYEAELYRLQGEMAADGPAADPNAAAAALDRAYEIATGQDARPFALRAALSRCRLLAADVPPAARSADTRWQALAGAVAALADEDELPDVAAARGVLGDG